MSGRTRLAHWLTTIYALMLVYASLQPFSGWMTSDSPFFLFAPAGRYTSFDFLVNLAAYLPFGLFATLVFVGRIRSFVLSVGLAALLSFSLEAAQTLLPSRAASWVDLLANTLGAVCGALCATALRQHPQWMEHLRQARISLFRVDRATDAGLALLVIWLMLQINPAIPLFGATFLLVEETPVDAAGALIEAAQSACNVLGVGLFLASLLRRRAHLGGAVLLLVGAGLLLKSAAALLLLRPTVWDYWLRPGVAMGVAIGTALLLALVWSRRRTQTLLGAIALLSGLIVPLIAPELMFGQAPLSLFSWHYGHLLNFNGLTRSGLLVWPLVAASLLIAEGMALPGRANDPV